MVQIKSLCYRKQIVWEDDNTGSSCGSIDRVVASNTRALRFESSHRQNLNWTVFTIDFIEKTKIEIRWGREWPIFKKKDGNKDNGSLITQSNI